MNESPSKTPARNPEDFLRLWKSEIELAEKGREQFLRRGRRIVRRYRSEAASIEVAEDDTTDYNIFWSNVETLLPATYSRRPRVEAFRRFRDEDPVGRLAGQILERGLQFEVDQGLELHLAMKAAVKDRLLPGMGQVWVRYEPVITTEVTQVPDPQQPLGVMDSEGPVVADEKTPVDYVYWGDFLVSPARSWADVRWVGRVLFYDKLTLEKRFGESYKKFGGDISKVPLTWNQPTTDAEKDKSGESDANTKRARVFEIWSKEHKQLFWICLEDCSYPLDIKEDIFKLDGFFPCPPPLIGTNSNDQFYPVADYILYQKQLVDLDTITRRMRSLRRSLRMVGVYDSSQQALKDLLNNGSETDMIPVSAWAAFAEKGGLKGVVDFLPIEQVIKVLQGLREEKEQLKSDIYEITGMSDIIRGSSLASETLGAQQIKAKFANLRLSSRQQAVAEFLTHILQIKAEIMCEQYSPETLIRISSAELLPEAQKRPELLEQAVALLKKERIRRYKIEIAAGSMIELDEVDERQRRTEFMETVSNFMNAAKNVASFDQEMMPVALEMLKFAVRGFSVGRGLEAAIEDAQGKIVERLKNPPAPQPDPDTVLKKEIEDMRQRGESERTKLTTDTQYAIAQLKQEGDLEKEARRQEHEALTGQVQRLHETAESSRKERQEERNLQAQREQEAQQAAQAAAQAHNEQVQGILQNLSELMQQVQALDEKSGRLRKRVPVYNEAGDIAEVREEFLQ